MRHRLNDDTFKMRLASDELTMLHEIAEARRVSAAQVVRECIRREHARTIKNAGSVKARGSRA